MVLIIIEALSSEAPWVGNEKQTSHVSIYVAEGVAGADVHCLADVTDAGADFVRIAERIPIEPGDRLVESLLATLSKHGIATETCMIYDE